MIGKHLPRATAWVIGGALLGLALGAAIGELTVQRLREDEIGELAEMYITRADEVSNAAIDALAETTRSPAPPCTDDDIAHLRRIVIRYQFVKSVSRLEGRRLICSATLGRLPMQATVPPPDLLTDRGRGVLFSASLFGIPDVKAHVIEEHDASVIVSPQTYAALIDARLDYVVVASVPGGQRVFMERGPKVAVERMALVDGRPVTANGRRYEVRCSDAHTGCIMATFRDPPAMLASPVLQGFAAFGLLAGMGGGLGVSLAIGRARSLSRRLRLALKRGDLSVVYQPIVRLADRRRVGAEALLRWKDDAGVHISPDVFIALAEQDGFITDVTRFVIVRALTELADALRAQPDFRITVNISAEDLLDPGFVTFVATQLRRRNLTPASIGFEVTERSTAERAQLADGIQRLRVAGHAVYLDDFGTAYSSLSYLADLHIDAIKLDRVFTLNLDENGKGASIAPQIVAMATGLGLTLVVEGIEADEQADYFMNLDPQALGQGWLFGKPQGAARLFGNARMAVATARTN